MRRRFSTGSLRRQSIHSLSTDSHSLSCHNNISINKNIYIEMGFVCLYVWLARKWEGKYFVWGVRKSKTLKKLTTWACMKKVKGLRKWMMALIQWRVCAAVLHEYLQSLAALNSIVRDDKVYSIVDTAISLSHSLLLSFWILNGSVKLNYEGN